jgi:hypothetical protein
MRTIQDHQVNPANDTLTHAHRRATYAVGCAKAAADYAQMAF